MLWMIVCIDKPNSEKLRAELTPAHLKYLDQVEHLIFLSSRQDTDDGSKFIGSIFIIRVPSRKDAEAFIQNEDFYRGGLFETVMIRRLNKGRFHPELLEGL